MGLPAWAVKGAKVVCVGTDPWFEPNGPLSAPTLGDTLTIRECVWIDKFAAVRFDEHVNPPRYRASLGRLEEYAFELKFFRPLISQQDDIEAHFKALLNVHNQVDA